MTFEYRVAAKIKKKAESLLRLVFRYVKSSYSAQQHPAPSAKIKVKIRFAGDDHLLFLLVIHILPSTLCQHCFMRGRRHSVLRRGESLSRDVIASAAKQTPVGWASRPSSFPRTRESSTSRDAGAYDLVAAGVPARHFLDPGSESGVTNGRQPPVSSGAAHRWDRSPSGTPNFSAAVTAWRGFSD